MMKKAMIGLAGLAAMMAANVVNAEDRVVKVKGFSFDPVVAVIQPGDSISWQGMTGHLSQSMTKMIPEGEEEWLSKMGEDYRHTFKTEGVYMYKCTPHVGAGMMGAVIVGNPTNLDAIKEELKTTNEHKGFTKRVLKKVDAALAPAK